MPAVIVYLPIFLLIFCLFINWLDNFTDGALKEWVKNLFKE